MSEDCIWPLTSTISKNRCVTTHTLGSYFNAWINPTFAEFPCVIDVVVLAAVPIFWLCYALDQCRVISVKVANDEVQVSRVAYFNAVFFYVDLLVVRKEVLRAVHFTNNSFHTYPSNKIEVDDKALPAGTEETVVDRVPSF